MRKFSLSTISQITVSALSLYIISAQSSLAQRPAGDEVKALQEEVAGIREIQKSIQADLKEIRKVLTAKSNSGQHQAVGAVVSVEGKQFKGDKNAKVTLIEYTDYECPFCARHVRNTIPKLADEYISKGKLKYVFADLPLRMHANAQKAAEAAYCAGEQGKFWEMHDLLFNSQGALAVTNLYSHAGALGLNVPRFQQCLDSDSKAEQTRKYAAEASKLGFTGTPSYVLGLTQTDNSTIKVIKVIVGASKYENFQEAIDYLLATPAPSPTAAGETAPK